MKQADWAHIGKLCALACAIVLLQAVCHAMHVTGPLDTSTTADCCP